MNHSLRIGVYALLIVLVVLGAAAGLAAAWYHDDACQIEGWQCDLGAFGFTQVFLGAISGAFALGWVVVELVRVGIGRPATPRPDSHSRDVAAAALAALLLLAGPWLIWIALEAG